MFPRTLLFFIFMMVIDLILKSVKDKQKIEKERTKRIENLSRRTSDKEVSNRKIVKPIEDRRVLSKTRIEKSEYKEPTTSLEMKPWEEPLFSDICDENTPSISKIKANEEKEKKSNKQMKEDILRGIIYSEILQKPKSIRNRQRSM
ncbi:hypothetical protein [Clostridium sp. Cult3]|uniref:hypothetical protein n=1 Tax=Clostridium sp. Cult3 TaxID=2079004 RepID=UPI001F20973F|nr:hypothetical protein [Clostridium sp. Cult3]MCF6461079.1 hypothetical protein [Clostridium sp. Cult3]